MPSCGEGGEDGEGGGEGLLEGVGCVGEEEGDQDWVVIDGGDVEGGEGVGWNRGGGGGLVPQGRGGGEEGVGVRRIFE